MHGISSHRESVQSGLGRVGRLRSFLASRDSLEKALWRSSWKSLALPSTPLGSHVRNSELGVKESRMGSECPGLSAPCIRGPHPEAFRGPGILFTG